MSRFDEAEDVYDFDDEPEVRSWHKQDINLPEDLKTLLEVDFQSVFHGDQGSRVFARLLNDLCFFRRCETEEEVVLNNYAKKLLSYLGDWDVGSEDSIVGKLLNN